MMQRCVHYYVDANSAQGYVSFLPETLSGIRNVKRLIGFPKDAVSALCRELLSKAEAKGVQAHLIHSCLTGEVAGVLIPENGFGAVALPPSSPDVVNAAELIWENRTSEIRSSLAKAHACFRRALAVHDDWEKIYKDAMDFEKMDRLTEETVDNLFDALTEKKGGTVIHRFFGAATVDGPKDFIPELTRGMKRRIFIKGRPGTGKSTFLKKIAAAAGRRGLDAEIYHCAFDPGSWDMVILAQLELCLFDSTSPHEYFPSREGDEIIDVYVACVRPGTDEENAETLAGFERAYRSEMEKAKHFLRSAAAASDALTQEVASRIGAEKIDGAIVRIVDEL